MSGGNIRNAAVRAAFLAAAEDRAVDMRTCMVAAERESREMGLLTRSALEGGTDGAEEAVSAQPLQPAPAPPPRMVPITHPRR
jgi:hypothetical protein